ncbi:hypothetical protein [Novosphingobium gossypii]|uniref:hypothetical protein n=1 Tax=Novosphingobium gossypii TaxID=1604774 RepID=UPI003D22E8AF
MRSISAISLAMAAACPLSGAAPQPKCDHTPEQRSDLTVVLPEPPVPIGCTG